MATFTLYLPDALAARLDELRGDRSRSAVVRAALEMHLSPTPVVEVSERPLPKIAPRHWG